MYKCLCIPGNFGANICYHLLKYNLNILCEFITRTQKFKSNMIFKISDSDLIGRSQKIRHLRQNISPKTNLKYVFIDFVIPNLIQKYTFLAV